MALAQSERSGTARRIVDTALELIQTRGFSAMSYGDIAERLAIRKASIHYYFPSKGDLGLAAIADYTGYFEDLLRRLSAEPELSAEDAFVLYCGPFREVAAKAGYICLCGALASEINVLPPPMQAGVAAFFRLHLLWLTHFLHLHAESGAVRLAQPPDIVAGKIFAALQGAVLLARAGNAAHQLDETIAALRADLGFEAK